MKPILKTPIQNKKLSEQALEIIREKIVSGVYKMGRPLLESELADTLGVSKSPIREALLQLMREGLVVMSPNRSALVFSMTIPEVISLSELRETLEIAALGLAIKRNSTKLIDALQSVVDQMRPAIVTNDVQHYKALDARYHMIIFEHCGSIYFKSNYETLSFRIQALRNRLSGDEKLNQSSLHDHQRIVELLREGESAKSAEALKTHIRTTTNNYVDRMQSNDAARRARKEKTGATALVPIEDMERFSREALGVAGADVATSTAVTRALLHASTLGVDTHGVRLLPHYLKALVGGRLNIAPQMRFSGQGKAVAVLDADNAHGALAAYSAMDRAMALARRYGVGAVAIRQSSHFGAAGAYAIEAARNNLFGMAFCNSDSFVRLHEGSISFHGTNPIAVAAPAPDQEPWLLDMATSSIPYNRIELFRSRGVDLPQAVASDKNGVDTTDPNLVAMLAPLGGKYGYKGAGLAGISEILSTAFGNAPLSSELAPMMSDDMSTPRGVGAFVLAMDPAAFSGLAPFLETMRRYLEAIHASHAVPGAVVMAPGDREWKEAARRRKHGLVVDIATIRAFDEFAQQHGIRAPQRNRM